MLEIINFYILKVLIYFTIFINIRYTKYEVKNSYELIICDFRECYGSILYYFNIHR